MLGKLKKTVKEFCPDCGAKTMELRVVEKLKFIEGDKSEYDKREFLYCSRCDFEEEYKDKKKRKPVKEL